jgi:C4-dicarboxylate-binding protein DctP
MFTFGKRNPYYPSLIFHKRRKGGLIMKNHWKLFLFVVALAGLILCLGATPAVRAETYEFKISIDTTPNHPRTMGLILFVEELKKRSGGRLVPTLYHSAQLYKDAHVTKALRMKTVDMAVPGNWVLEGFDTNTSLTMLPMFFGQPGEITEALLDGPVGEKVNASLEKKVKVKALGPWYELGYDNVWTVKKKITKIEDFQGLKIRHSGGSLPDARLKALGANPVFIAWPDVPMAMVQGTIDGLCTTAKSAESAKLDEAGIKYGVFCRNFNAYYVPMMSLTFWNKLPADLKKTVLEVWKENTSKQREMARREQKKGEEYLMSKGVEIWYPDNATLAKWRNHIMPVQDEVSKKLGHDPELIKAAMKALGM